MPEIDQRYYQVARPGSLAERMAILARDAIYADFVRLAAPEPGSTILDVGVSDVVGEAANVIERKYPHRERLTAVGLGEAGRFREAFPEVAYRQIAPGEALPFADGAFDIATSNAVLEHVGSAGAQARFVAELARVSRVAFITVPHRFFPVEHHTGIPLLHWSDRLFQPACRALGRGEWAEEANLILMTATRLRETARGVPRYSNLLIGRTGIRLGPLSSNLFLLIRAHMRR